MKPQKTLEKGCGKMIDWDSYGEWGLEDYVCIETNLCPICQALLQQSKEITERIDIPKLIKDFELRLERGCTEIEAFIFVLEELKSTLIGSEEKKFR